jgi:hypothetical protein
MKDEVLIWCWVTNQPLDQTHGECNGILDLEVRIGSQCCYYCYRSSRLISWNCLHLKSLLGHENSIINGIITRDLTLIYLSVLTAFTVNVSRYYWDWVCCLHLYNDQITSCKTNKLVTIWLKMEKNKVIQIKEWIITSSLRLISGSVICFTSSGLWVSSR